jgi:regulator of RNase E activity RraB
MLDEYPNDADGDALRRIASDSNDMSRPMDVEFQIAAADETAAKKVADAAAKLGYRTSIYFDDGDVDEEHVADPWTCECTKNMVLTYDAVIAAQLELDAIARPISAYSDGWGTFGNADTST